MSNLEQTVSKPKKESWLKKAYKEEWPTMGNHAIACFTAIGTAAGFSHFADALIDSDAIISTGASIVDSSAYWLAFLPQILYRDRNKLRNDEGKFDRRKAAKKTGEYLGYIGVGEGLYIVARSMGQYVLQKRGWDPVAASATVQTGFSVCLTFVWPPLRYLTRKWSER